jgi:hypothetical protein
MSSSLPALRRMPAVLRRRIRDDAPDVETHEPWWALMQHYGLGTKFRELMDAPPSDRKQVLATLFWSDLALCLLFDFVPAYRNQKPGRHKTATANLADWINAGGNGLQPPAELTSFTQAQFVLVIAEQQRLSGRSRAWVFKWFANEVAKTTLSQAAARRELLPQLYRKRTTSGSLKQAFNDIPLTVRENPTRFLPPPAGAQRKSKEV